MSKKVDWGKELWCILLFGCIGFTVWPLMVYYLGQALHFTYFMDLPLRTWAEQKVYGPLSWCNFRSILSLLFLLSPLILSIFLRSLLCLARK
jgi:hypothetical protein